jgi:pyruvate dehydrogenase E2 component (dihydrolipoamide acetyltransferase)
MAEIIEMPKLSDTMTTGTLVKWLKNEGDEIATGDMIAEVETDKATMEVECFEDGFMLKQYVAEGDSVSIGAPICAVGEEGEEAPEPNSSGGGESGHDGEDDDEAGKTEEASSGEEKEAADQQESEEKPTEEEAAPAAPPAKKTAPAGDAPAPPAPQTKDGKRIKSSPLARKIAAELDVDLTRVEGSGPGGRIIRADVEAAAEAGTASASAPTGTAAPSGTATPAGPAFAFAAIEETTTKVSNMRASIAKALVKSKQEAPHFYLQSEVDAAPLARMRKDLNGFLAERDPQAGGVKYTVNDLILRAAVLAAQRVPAINRSWQGDKILQSEGVHLAFGVAIDDGLVTPVIRDAQDKPLRSVAAEARELIGKARNRKLKPDEMAGSTLTVTNLGMYGITDFYGIINPGNAAILSVGATRKEPVVDEDDRISVGYRMKVGLSGDHRVIDGAVGAQYLDALRDLLEKPSILLV